MCPSYYFIALSVVCCARVALGDGGGMWGYGVDDHGHNREDSWKLIHDASCGGARQSPINIVSKYVVFSQTLRSVKVSEGIGDGNVTLKATKTSLSLGFTDRWNISFNDDDCLRPVSIHWHWGSKDSQGSEHTIDDTKYPIEGHLVTYNCKLYNNISTALLADNALYVVGMLYQIGEPSQVLEKVLANIKEVVKNGSVTVPEILPSEFLPKNRSNYYRYEGSLTTPPCTENVVWTVFSELQTIGANQLSIFRSLNFGPPETGHMVDNFRSTQINRNTVYSSFRLYNQGFLCSINCVTTFLVLAAALLLHRA